ncbi:DUF4097 family beta strand repeat-containing protein [Mycolicibacterium novocastrense]|uniref:DUF4097 family beta strand repeat-containing protein n=1 Tax=Mycolicibacterium novocastrense TaxID=59813 RepID=UPI000A644201|nr:DUF4097 family beta strand repeat-containing protein [Mycolicibacterium novocastrense]
MCLSVVGGLGAVAIGLGGTRVVSDTQVLPADLTALTIDTGDVPVNIHLVADADAATPRIDMRLATRNDGVQLTVADEGTDSRVSLADGGYGFLGFNGAGDINVVLPPNVAKQLSITVNQQAGSLSADATLDRLVVKTERGAVTLGGSAREIDVEVGRGDISTSNGIAVSESFRATTEVGSISAQFRLSPRSTEANAGGDVTVQLPGPEPYWVRAESDRGTLVTVPQTPNSDAPTVTARSENGNVEVTELR